jgi:5-formyltetrahydrofolate cyclo-ligase
MSLIAPKNYKKLYKNKYNIFEPSDGDEINPIDHEIIIIPTVGVDKNGYRLGYGGGLL